MVGGWIVNDADQTSFFQLTCSSNALSIYLCRLLKQVASALIRFSFTKVVRHTESIPFNKLKKDWSGLCDVGLVLFCSGPVSWDPTPLLSESYYFKFNFLSVLKFVHENLTVKL